MSLVRRWDDACNPAGHELGDNRDSCANLSIAAPAANIRNRCRLPVFSRLVSLPPVTTARLAAALDAS